MTMNDDPEAIYREAIDAINRGDDEGAVALFAEDGVVIDFSAPSVVHRGRPAVAAVIRGYRELFPELRMELLETVTDERRIAAEIVLRGRRVGESDQVELRYCTVSTFEEGLIVSEHLYADSRVLAGEA